MTGSLAGLLLLNALYVVLGFELLPLLRIAHTREQLWSRLGMAYIVGTAFVGVLATYLALAGVPVGLLEVTVLALIGGALAWRPVRRLPCEVAAATRRPVVAAAFSPPSRRVRLRSGRAP